MGAVAAGTGPTGAPAGDGRLGSVGGLGIAVGCDRGLSTGDGTGLGSARGVSTLAGSGLGGVGGVEGSSGDDALAAAAGRSASISRRTGNTALHTAQRARTPASGTLAGSTR
ncbi:MAG TPA: hypothetical protein VJ808_04495 [Gemmatimonadales bacterium]|nr:hypothetical protein [Gemmatimonadales bacterium]